MLGTTCKRHEMVHEGHTSKWIKRAPRAMNEPAYWRDHAITAPTAGPNAKLVKQQPSWQAVLPDSRHARHHPQAAYDGA